MRSSSPGTRAAEILKRDPELQPHLEALGLKSVQEYTLWCAQNGFSTRIDKHWRDRCKERYFATQGAIRLRLTRHKDQKRKHSRLIQQVFDGEIDQAELIQPHWLLVYQLATSCEDEPTRAAFRHLLLHVESRTRLLTTQPAMPQFGTQDGNTFIQGMFALARNHPHWIRSLPSWEPRSHNVRRQFSSLAGHLLAKYPVPLFMDSVWFQRPSDDARRQQAWYRALGNGVSPRTLDLPIPLTKRMAHYFLRAPKDCSVNEALRWGQVIGLGGNGRLVKAILGSRIGTNFEDNDFWTTVVRWLVQNPMFDPAQVGPLIDYIHNQRFGSSGTAVGPERTDACPSEPAFTMQGRTAASLLRQMREWHDRLRKEPEKPQLEWPESGIGAYEWTEGMLGGGNLRRWTIIELRSRKELYHEGHVMRHCVASYDNSCAFGKTSIWSLGVERNGGRRKRALTVEVINGAKVICQVRGKANRLPSQQEMDILRRWASQETLVMANHVGT